MKTTAYLTIVVAVVLGAWCPAQLLPGDYLVTDSRGNIWQVNPGRKTSTFVSHSTGLYGIDFDASGNVICGTGSSTLIRVTPTGAITTILSGSPLSGILGDVEVNSQGNYFIPVWSGATVVEISPSGTVVTSYATPSGTNWGTGLDEKTGRLYVNGSTRVYSIDLGTGVIRTLHAGTPLTTRIVP